MNRRVKIRSHACPVGGLVVSASSLYATRSQFQQRLLFQAGGALEGCDLLSRKSGNGRRLDLDYPGRHGSRHRLIAGVVIRADSSARHAALVDALHSQISLD